MVRLFLIFFIGLCLAFHGCLTSSSNRALDTESTTFKENQETEKITTLDSDERSEPNATIEEATQTIENSKISSDTTPEEVSKPEETLDQEERAELLRLSLRGNYLEDKGLHEEASQVFAQAYKQYPESAYLAARTGHTLLNSGSVDKAIEYASKAVEINPHHTDALLVMGQAHSRQKQWDQAITYYETITEIDPHEVDAHQKLAELYQKVGNNDLAIKCYRELIDLNPYQETIYRYAIAVLLFQANRYDEALEAYKRLSELMPYNTEILVRIGSIQERMGKTEEAIETYLTTLEWVNNSDDELAVRKRLATLYQVRNSPLEAIHQYKRIKELIPENLDVRKTLANLYIQQEEYEKALKEVEPLAEKSPGNYPIHQLKHETLITLDREKEAWISFVDAFEDAIYENQKNDIQLFLLKLGEQESFRKLSSYHQLKRFSTLLDSTSEIEKTPRIPFVQANLHDYLDQENALEEKLELILSRLDEAISQGDGEWVNEIVYEVLVWYRLRNAFLRLEKTQDLLNRLDKGLHVFPDTLNLLKVAGLASMDLEDWKQAKTYLEKAFQETKNNGNSYRSVLYPLATVYDKLDAMNDVESLMRDAIKRFPDDPQPYNFLGYSLAERGIRLDEAQELIEKAIELDPHDGNILDSLGWVYYQQGNTEKAIQHLERANQLKENHPVILDHLGDAYAKNGRLHKALKYWKKSLKHGPKYPVEFTTELESQIRQKIRETEPELSQNK